MKFDLEKIFLLIFLALALFFGPGAILDHKIIHGYPYGYGASDAFQHEVRAQAILDTGNFRYEAPYLSKGIEGAVGRYPPLLYHLVIGFSLGAGIEVYEGLMLIVLLFSIIACFLMYFIIRDYNRNIAILSLPFMLLIFSFPPAVGFYYGHLPSLLSQVFLLLFFFLIMKRDLEGSWALIGTSFGGVLLTHTSEAVFGGIFLALFFIGRLISRSLHKKDIFTIGIGLSFGVLLALHFIIIFLNTWAKSQPYEFLVQPLWDGNPGFYFLGFGLLVIPLLLGLLFSFFKWRDLHLAFTIALSMIFCGYLNYAGFEVRSFQLRFFWPIYLAILIGFGIYITGKLIVKNENPLFGIALSSVFLLIVLGVFSLPSLAQREFGTIPFIPQIGNPLGAGMMDPYHWEALNFISRETSADSSVYFFYGDIYSQDALLRASKRVHAQADPSEFISALQSRKILREYVSELPGDNGGTIAVRKGLFSFEDASKKYPSTYFFEKKDVCAYDYFVFDKMSRQEILAQYNLLIARQMAMNHSATQVFDNQVVLILKNNNKNGECVHEEDF